MGKNIVLSIALGLVLLLILMLVMSDSVSTNTPKDVTKKFLVALAKKDLQAAKLYSTAESKTLLAMVEKALYKNTEELEVQTQIVEQIEKMPIECKKYENKAVCNCNTNSPKPLELDLVKEDNVWLVKVDINFFVNQGKETAQDEQQQNTSSNYPVSSNKPLTKGSSSKNTSIEDLAKSSAELQEALDKLENKKTNYTKPNLKVEEVGDAGDDESEGLETTYSTTKITVNPINNAYVIAWVDRARLRTAPTLDSETIHFIAEGEMLKNLGQRSRHTEIIELRGANYEAHWIKVQTLDGLFEGWVFEGAVK